MSPPAARPRDARRSRRYPSRALVAALLVVAHLALVEASEEEDPGAPRAAPSIAAYPIPLPADARCPWTSDGVVPAARANPLVRAVLQRTRMAAPFGPGSWPRPFVVPSEDDEPRFGWTRAIILVADVRVDPERAAKWLPRSIMDTTSDVARVFVAWYPDSFCCGSYHEAAILLDVTHAPSGARATHCPWMLVDKDRSMIAGREVLGFPKKLASNISLVVDGEEVSSNERLAKLDPEELRAVFPPGASIEASVTREGVELLRLTGRVASREAGGGGTGGDDEGSIHSNGRRRGAASSSSGAFGGGETVFLNVRTTHPLPPDSASAPDPACLGDRPKTVQFVFDEVPAEDATRDVDDVRVVVRGSRVDPIAAPFADEPTRGGDEGEAAEAEPEVLGARIAVTNLYTGTEPAPTLGETVPPGYLERDEVYWLRYQ